MSCLRHILTYLMIVSLLAGLSACQWVIDPVVDPTFDDSATFRLTLTILSNTSAGNTRAGNDDDYEEVGHPEENYIAFREGDFRLVIFDNNGNYLMELGAAEAESIVEGNNEYKIEYELVFPETITASTIEQIRNNGVQVVIIANCKSLDQTFVYSDKFNVEGSSKNLVQLWRNNTTFNYQYALGEYNSTWLPKNSAISQKLIPMFGYSKSLKFSQDNASGEYRCSTVIPMQRAMAKIEVIDHLENQPDLYVKDVTMTDMVTLGRVIPNVAQNPNWNQTGSQVTASSLPAGTLMENHIVENLKFWHDEQNKKWIAYVPEMKLLDENDGLILDPVTKVFDSEKYSDRTHLDVKIGVKPGSTLKDYDGGNYIAHFAKYTPLTFEPSIPDGSWNHILRNHIYRFSVNKVGLTVQLHLHVIPWQPDDDEVWDYTDNVTVQQALKWVPDSYEKIVEETGEVYLSLENNQILKGSFRISTPINGRWYARLVPLDGAKTNAVTFTDAEGNPLTPNAGTPPACLEISGLIATGQDEVPTVFFIKPTSTGSEEESRFRLEFLVENFGSWTTVPMVDVNGVEYTTYTIVRQGNLIL